MEFKITKQQVSQDTNIYSLLYLMESNSWQLVDCKVTSDEKEAIEFLTNKAKEKAGDNIIKRFTL